MKNTYFICPSDGAVNTTAASCALLRRASDQGLNSLALKPVATGARQSAEGLRSEAALLLQQAMSGELDYEQINPYPLEADTEPLFAAAAEAKSLGVSRLAGYCRGALFGRYDFALIEAEGGWRSPLNEREQTAHLARELQLPVILVVGSGRACLNQAALTAGSIRAEGLALAGWVALGFDPGAPFVEAQLEALAAALRAPCLGQLSGAEDAPATPLQLPG